jgi:hypothetical protein
VAAMWIIPDRRIERRVETAITVTPSQDPEEQA